VGPLRSNCVYQEPSQAGQRLLTETLPLHMHLPLSHMAWVEMPHPGGSCWRQMAREWRFCPASLMLRARTAQQQPHLRLAARSSARPGAAALRSVRFDALTHV
jgi:hypothetical protein